jgi:hypothetical protein
VNLTARGRVIPSVNRIPAAIAALTVILAAGCGSAGGAAAASPPTRAAGARGKAADVRACRAMSSYPKSAMTAAKLGKVVSFLISEAAKPRMTPGFSGQMEQAAADLEAFLAGVRDQGQVKRDIGDLTRSCDRYGVRASL